MFIYFLLLLLLLFFIVLLSKRFGSGASSVELTALLFILDNEHFLGLHLSVIEKTTSVEPTFDNSSCYIYQLFYFSIFRFGGKRRIRGGRFPKRIQRIRHII